MPGQRTMLMRSAGWRWVLGVVVLTGCGRAPATPIGRAAYAGDATRVASLLAQGADPNDLAPTGLTPLMYAARAGHVAVVRVLLEQGSNPDVPDRAATGWTALIHAIHRRQDAAARALLDGGAEPDVRVGHGATALVYAAAYGNTAIVRELLARGADPHVATDDGVTPLWATLGGGGIVDVTDGPRVGTCFPDTAAALLERAPDLRLPTGAGVAEKVAALGRTRECRDLVARLR